MARTRLLVLCSWVALVGAGCSSSGDGGASSSPASSAAPASVPASSAADGSTPPSPPAGSTPATGAASLAGTWHGTYESQKFSTATGEFTVTFTQHDSNITGAIEIHPSCVAKGTVTGTISGTTISFGQVSGSRRTVAFTGTVRGDEMHGTYTSPASCGNDHGTWEARKA